MKSTLLIAASILMASLCCVAETGSQQARARDLIDDSVPFIQNYMALLTEGRYEDAVELTDYEALTEYLLDWRLRSFKAENPEAGEEDIDALRQQVLQYEIPRPILRDRLLSMIEAVDPMGVRWEMAKVTHAHRFPDSLVLDLALIDAEGNRRPFKMGIRREEGEWKSAPYLVEQIAMLTQPRRIIPPDEVVTLMDDFWGYWNRSELEKSYPMLSAKMQKKVSLLAFLESVQEMLSENGILVSWELVDCLAIREGHVNTFYKLEFSESGMQAMVGLVGEGTSWRISGLTLPYPPEEEEPDAMDEAGNSGTPSAPESLPGPDPE